MVSRQDARALLRDGIDIAKSGDKKRAHTLLAQATCIDPRNEQAWLWLAGVANDFAEAVNCLRHVLAINPDNLSAKKGLACLGVNSSASGMQITVPSRSQSLSPDFYRAVTIPTGSNNAKAVSTSQATIPASDSQQPTSNQPASQNESFATVTPLPDGQAQGAQAAMDTQLELDEVSNAEIPVRTIRVLIVDDSPTIRKLVAMTLGKHGYEVVSAADGMEALARINDGAPDLILLDITMPRMDGYQLCKTIKTNHATDHIPIVMLTGKDGFIDKVRGRMAGSEGYLTKPFDPAELVRMVKNYVRD